MYWLDQLKKFKKEQKATYKGISEQTGISLTTIEKLFSGRTSEPKLLMIDRIVRTLGHSLPELVETPPNAFVVSKDEIELLSRLRRLDGTGIERIHSAVAIEEHRIRLESTGVRYHKVFYDFPVSAGTGEYLDDSTVAIAEIDEEPPKGTDYILRIAGDSMEPEFYDGDYIYVQRTNSIEYRDIGIFSYRGNVYVKEYTRYGLRSFNPNYKLIPGSPEIKCLGRVLGKVTGAIWVC